MFYSILKRILDITVSLVLLVASLPILIIIAICIYFNDPGPVLFRQSRMGRGMRQFKLLKFRSMIMNAPDLRNVDGSTFNSLNDPRVTSLGHFLRNNSLDELPQLINVLLGDMSLVGPRPDPPDASSLYREKDFQRLSVPQGITGWAQINGRNSISWEKRRDYDLDYLEIKSIYLDIKILFITLFQVLKRKGVNTH